MVKYASPSTAPAEPTAFQRWVIDELRHISDAFSEIDTNTWVLKEWNVEPDKLYDGLIIFADGSNFDPGSGQGFYGYYAAAWHFLG